MERCSLSADSLVSVPVVIMSLRNGVRCWQAAVVTGKYHLTKSLIQKVKSKNELLTLRANGQNLAHMLAKTAEPAADRELLTQVCVCSCVFLGL